MAQFRPTGLRLESREPAFRGRPGPACLTALAGGYKCPCMLINRLLQVAFISGAVSLVVPAFAHSTAFARSASAASPSVPLCGDDEDSSHKGVKKDAKKKDDAEPGKDDGKNGDDAKDKDGEEPAAA